MKQFIRATVAVLAVAFAAPAFAGGITVAQDGDTKLKLEGKVFADLTSYKKTTANGTSTTTLSSRVERAYFTSKYSFNSDWMMRITTDVVLTSAVDSKGAPVSKNNNIFLKYAYLEGKLAGDAAVLRLGQSHTPWIDYEQGLWGHRYFAKVLSDTNGYDASSDVGIGLKGKVADGMANYWVTLTNGAGYSHIDRTGSAMDLDARVGLNVVEGLTLDAQYRNGYKGTKSTGVAGTKYTLLQLMATYGMGHDWRAGFNYANNKTAPVGSSVTETAMAFWGWAKFGNNMGAFGRYETTSDNAAPAKNEKTHLAVGVEYHPVKHVTLALGIDTTDAKLGGASNGKTQRYGLWSETKF